MCSQNVNKWYHIALHTQMFHVTAVLPKCSHPLHKSMEEMWRVLCKDISTILQLRTILSSHQGYFSNSEFSVLSIISTWFIKENNPKCFSKHSWYFKIFLFQYFSFQSLISFFENKICKNKRKCSRVSESGLLYTRSCRNRRTINKRRR